MRRTTSVNDGMFIGGPEFGTLLRTHRRRAGLTQQALAELATVSSRAIRDLECERARARARTVQLLADGLGLTGLTRQAFVDAGRRTAGGPETTNTELDTDPPHSGDPLFGRDSEVHALIHALESQRRRAISVLGLGGVGKSRTVLEVARQLHQQRKWPVLWVPAGSRLQHVKRGRLVAEIRMQLESSSPDVSQVCRLIGEHDALMVLDDLATVGPAAGDLLQDMLGRCPGLRIIVTTRGPAVPLGCQPAMITPLPIPPDDAEAGSLARIATVPSVQLLVERLAEIQPGWALTPDDIHAVAVLCRRLDGLPLALEIAAHQCTVLSPQELASLPAADLLGLSAPAASGESVSVSEIVATSCALLDETQLSRLRVLSELPASWTVYDVEAALGLARAEVVSTLVVLTRLGLVRRQHCHPTSVFHVLNLVRDHLRPVVTPGVEANGRRESPEAIRH
jgi:transcriptional regulator with XRE-family HTH domain